MQEPIRHIDGVDRAGKSAFVGRAIDLTDYHGPAMRMRWDAMTRQYRSEALAAAHEAALGLAEAGLMSKRTMRKFDEMCLTPVREMAPEEIRALRLREHASQAVFARYLNVTTGLVSQWERGEKRPRGASLKLLTLVAKNGLGAVA